MESQTVASHVLLYYLIDDERRWNIQEFRAHWIDVQSVQLMRAYEMAEDENNIIIGIELYNSESDSDVMQTNCVLLQFSIYFERVSVCGADAKLISWKWTNGIDINIVYIGIGATITWNWWTRLRKWIRPTESIWIANLHIIIDDMKHSYFRLESSHIQIFIFIGCSSLLHCFTGS